MAVTIRQNLAARFTLKHLADTQRKLATSFERLSSGYKINRASDDAAGLALSQRIRGRISGLNQAADNSELGISMLRAAESSLAEINAILLRMRELALHAMNAGPNDESMLAADQAEISACLEGIDRITAETRFGDKHLLDGSKANIISVKENVSGIVGSTNSTLSEGTHEIDVSNWIAANQSINNLDLGLSQPIFPHGLAAGDHTISVIQESDSTYFESGVLYFDEPLVLTDGINDRFYFSLDAADPVTVDLVAGGAVTFSDLDSLATVVEAAVKSALGGVPDVEIRVTATEEGALQFKTTDHGTESSITISDSDLDDSALADLHLDSGTEYGKNAIITLDNFENIVSNVDNLTPSEIELRDKDNNDITFQIGDSSTGIKAGTAVLTINPERFLVSLDGGPKFEFESGEWSTVSNGSESIRLLFGEYVAEGTNTLDASENALTFNINGETDFAFEGVSPAHLGLREGRLSTIDLSTAEGAASALEAIDEANTLVSSERARMGAFQKNVLEVTLNQLLVEIENLTAAESVIRDADFAFEIAEMTKLQIMQEAGTAVLAQANISPQTVLRLLS